MSDAFEITGADGTTIPIAPGGYYMNTKARGRRMMANSLSGEARRVYACLELATMGFQQELAVTMEKGKKRHLTPGDIVIQTGLLKQNVRRGLEELEEQGLAKREADDGGKLRNGHIVIYSWAVPREPIAEKGNSARLPFPPWFPASWEPLKPLIKRLKLSVSLDEESARDYFEEGEKAASDYQKAEKVVVEFLERVCAPRVYKEERTERTSERKGSSSSASSSFVGEPAEELENQTTTNPLPKEENEGHPLVAATLAEYAHADPAAVTELIEKCQRAAPSVTQDEICIAIRAKAPLAARNVTGFLLKALPAMLAGHGLEQLRAGLPAAPGRKKGPDTSYLDAIIAGGGGGG